MSCLWNKVHMWGASIDRQKMYFELGNFHLTGNIMKCFKYAERNLKIRKKCLVLPKHRQSNPQNSCHVYSILNESIKMTYHKSWVK